LSHVEPSPKNYFDRETETESRPAPANGRAAPKKKTPDRRKNIFSGRPREPFQHESGQDREISRKFQTARGFRPLSPKNGGPKAPFPSKNNLKTRLIPSKNRHLCW
jgi:hypothetical protein